MLFYNWPHFHIFSDNSFLCHLCSCEIFLQRWKRICWLGWNDSLSQLNVLPINSLCFFLFVREIQTVFAFVTYWSNWICFLLSVSSCSFNIDFIKSVLQLNVSLVYFTHFFVNVEQLVVKLIPENDHLSFFILDIYVELYFALTWMELAINRWSSTWQRLKHFQVFILLLKWLFILVFFKVLEMYLLGTKVDKNEVKINWNLLESV